MDGVHRKKFEEARKYQERAATMAEKQPAVLPEVLYDLAVIRLAAGDKGECEKGAGSRAPCSIRS